MKHKVLATLLLFTTIPFFANDTTIQKPTKTELLAHLRATKIKIEECLSKELETKNMMIQEFGKEEYYFLLNVYKEINQARNNAMNPFDAPTEQHYLDLLCTMKAIDEISTTDDIDDYMVIDPSNKQDSALINAIFLNHHKKYRQENPNGSLINIMYKDLCSTKEDYLWIPFLVKSMVSWLKKMYKKIEEKEMELLAQP